MVGCWLLFVRWIVGSGVTCGFYAFLQQYQYRQRLYSQEPRLTRPSTSLYDQDSTYSPHRFSESRFIHTPSDAKTIQVTLHSRRRGPRSGSRLRLRLIAWPAALVLALCGMTSRTGIERVRTTTLAGLAKNPLLELHEVVHELERHALGYLRQLGLDRFTRLGALEVLLFAFAWFPDGVG